MTLAKINIPPGVVADRADYSAGPVWTAGDKVRFQQGLPEKWGGWQKETGWSFNGQPNQMLIWHDLSGNDIIAVGTSSKLYVVFNDLLYDITPVAQTVNPMGDPPFSMSSGSATVVVTDSARNPNVGDFVVFSGAAAAAGITIDGEYEVQTVPGATTYTITHTAVATSTATGGGASVVATYLLPTGSVTITGFGWGAGGYGASGGGWGSAATTGVSLEPPLWSLDNWGEDLVATKRQGGTYIWDASVGTGTRAAIVTNAPATTKFSMVSTPDRHLVCLGAHDGVASDPMLVAWSDQEVTTTWAPATSNTAGSQRLGVGSRIVAGLRTRDQILLWTDDALYSMEYQGPPYTFGFRLLATGCGAISQNSVIEENGVVYWMTESNFHVYDGAVRALPCPVHDYVYEDINDQKEPFIATGRNQRFSELLWFYTSSAASVNDRFVGLNYDEGTWQTGTLDRVAWHDESAWVDHPVGLDSSGNLYYHENGTDDHESAMTASIESGAIEIPEAGELLFFMDKFIPDLTITGTLYVTFYTRKYPGGPETSKGPYAMTSATEKLSVRVRGRQLRFKLESSTKGDAWTFGTPRLQFRGDSKR